MGLCSGKFLCRIENFEYFCKHLIVVGIMVKLLKDYYFVILTNQLLLSVHDYLLGIDLAQCYFFFSMHLEFFLVHEVKYCGGSLFYEVLNVNIAA